MARRAPTGGRKTVNASARGRAQVHGQSPRRALPLRLIAVFIGMLARGILAVGVLCNLIF